MRQIDDYFSNNADLALYHYTGVGSLLGMAESKSAWASNAYYLNDSKEIIHACDVLRIVLKPRLAFGDQESEETKFLYQFLDWVESFRFTMFNLFVFSLSEVPSLLSQWRSYTPHGKGVSIGFSANTINKLIKNSNLRLAKCLYEDREHGEVLGSLVEMLLITFRRELPNIDVKKSHPSQCYHKFLDGFRGDVLQVLSIIKHEAFKEEREWRLISPYYPEYTIPEIKFREGASMLVPYIELKLVGKPYFEKIILGPSAHQNLSASAVSMFLSNQEICNQTENCNIPYREW